MSKQRAWNGGENIRIPLNLESYTQLGSYSGFDALSVTQQNTRQYAVFYPSQEYVSMSISGIQKSVNSGDAAVLDLISVEMEQRTKDFRDELGRQMYLDGTGNSQKDLLGLQAAVDDSTSVSTYGTVSRSTYTNWRATRTAQSGSLSLANLAADFDAAQVGNDAPSLIVATPAIFSIYEALLTPTVQHNLSFSGYDMVTASGIQRGQAAGNGFRALSEFHRWPLAC